MQHDPVALNCTSLDHLLGLVTHALTQSTVFELVLTDSFLFDECRDIGEWVCTRRKNEHDRILVGRALIDLIIANNRRFDIVVVLDLSCYEVFDCINYSVRPKHPHKEQDLEFIESLIEPTRNRIVLRSGMIIEVFPCIM